MSETNLPAGQTTQLVVGAGRESDEEIFKRVLYEYQEIGVKRAYYSAFSPQKGTPFANKEPQPLWREHRLYQMDWLYRIYRFHPQEIEHAFDENGFLQNRDPKMTIAKELMDLPVDPNTASYQELLRVPGIGPRSAQRIAAFRKRQPVTGKATLASLGGEDQESSSLLEDQWLD